VAVIALLLFIPTLSGYGPVLTRLAATPSPTPAPTFTQDPAIPSQTPAVARATPTGTPAPAPSEPIENVPSVTVSPPPAPRRTPAPEPGLWRIQGYVVDAAGAPIENVCVVVGPRGCQQHSPHTDERGHYFLDVAESQTALSTFDFYFEMPGHETVWWRVTPNGPVEFNVVLKKA
jgi:hypothetical protein